MSFQLCASPCLKPWASLLLHGDNLWVLPPSGVVRLHVEVAGLGCAQCLPHSRVAHEARPERNLPHTIAGAHAHVTARVLQLIPDAAAGGVAVPRKGCTRWLHVTLGELRNQQPVPLSRQPRTNTRSAHKQHYAQPGSSRWHQGQRVRRRGHSTHQRPCGRWVRNCEARAAEHTGAAVSPSGAHESATGIAMRTACQCRALAWPQAQHRPWEAVVAQRSLAGGTQHAW